MSLRRLPPVYSPLTWAAIRSGFDAARDPAAADGARATTERWLRTTFVPRAYRFTDSGTSALRLALSLAVAQRPDRRIALPAWGCYDLATACDGAGVEVLFYDLVPDRLTPDWGSLREALAAGAQAVVVVHFFGVPVPMADVRTLTREYGATIIEDAAQAAGASLDGRPCGGLGDMAVLSFGRGKGITGGRGGALLAYTPAWAGQLPESLGPAPAGWMDLPKAVVQMVLARPATYAIPAALPFLRLGETIYHAPHEPGPGPRASLGMLARTTALAAAEAERRRTNAALLQAALTESSGLLGIGAAEGAVPGYLRFPVLARRGGSAPFARPGAAALGIMPGYPMALTELPGFGTRALNGNTKLTGAFELARTLGTCPTHGLLSPGDLGRIVRWIQAAA